MNDKEQAAMQQALEALCQLHFAATERDKKNRVRWFDKAIDESVEAITALREALAKQAERDLVNKSAVDWYSLTGSTRKWGEGMVEAMFAIGNDDVVYVIAHESVKDIAFSYLPIA